MGRRQSGGNTSAVKEIMIGNLCRETKNGDTLKDKDASSFVQVQNLCTTANDSNMNNTRSNNTEEVNTSTEVNNSTSSTFSGGNLLFNVGSMMTAPMRKMLSLVGVDTGKLTENAKNKVNSMLNKKVENTVSQGTNQETTTVVNKNSLEEKIVNKLDNFSGGRRRTKKGKGKVRGKGKGNKSSKRRRNRTKRR